MNKKGITQALVDVLSYLAIIVIIGSFYMAITFQNNKLKMDISAEVKSKALSGIMVNYLNMPAEKGTNADAITAMMKTGKVSSFSMDYFEQMSKRTGYCVEYITFYSGKDKLGMRSSDECLRTGLAVFNGREASIRLDKAWILLPSDDGMIYMIEAGGFWVRP